MGRPRARTGSDRLLGLPIVPGQSLDLEAFLALPRLVTLHLSPDGSRLALTVSAVSADRKRFASSIWEISPTGAFPARRLTRSAKGETARGYLPDGSLLFTSSRVDAQGDDDARPEGEALYVLPAVGGEPQRVLAPPAGVGDVVTAAASATVVVTAALAHGTSGFDEDAAWAAARAKAGVEALLIEHYPDRYWDHRIGPREPRIHALDLAAPGADPPVARDLTPNPPWAGWIEDVAFALSADGAQLAFGAATEAGAAFRANLAVLDTAGGDVRLLVDADVDHGPLAWSPDGRAIASAWTDLGGPGSPPRFHLGLVDARTGEVTELAPGFDGQAMEIHWTSDGRALLVTADQRGHTPIFRIDLDGTVTRLTASGAYRSLAVAPDGVTLYAIRSHVDEVPVPVALAVTGADQPPRVLPGPVAPVVTGVRLEEVTATAPDGAEVHSWLVLPGDPAGAPFPLAVAIHGGPVASWTGWHWRWSACVLAARGWAVLLPNPRLSTGCGHAHIADAWGDWTTLPAGDILAATDVVTTRADIDAERTAALGGSYGGYMANWLAVTTQRFAALVTHASVWDLQHQRGSSDVGFFMDREFGHPLRDEANWRSQSPHLLAERLRTPMLVIHGARDERVPITNAHSLWMELQVRGVPSRLLLFPDENHWILKPQNARLWYETVFAFLGEHVLGEAWQRPGLT